MRPNSACKGLYFLLFFILQNAFGFSQKVESPPFFEACKKFAYLEFSDTLEGDFFCKKSEKDEPFIYIYVSLANQVKCPEELKSSYIFCDHNEKLAEEKENYYKSKGYHVFRYKTNANSNTLLNSRLLSYPKEAISFTVLHELMHNYITQNNLKIPYELNEALCDLVGNYGTLKFSMMNSSLDQRVAQFQIENNEKIFRCINWTIEHINKHPKRINYFTKRCYKRIQRVLKTCNTFQKDRFNFEVNNAYLIKNEYYCKNYFLLKNVLLKQKSIKGLLRVMKGLDKKGDWRSYLQSNG